MASLMSLDRALNVKDAALNYRWVCTSCPRVKGESMSLNMIEGVDISIPHFTNEAWFMAATRTYYPSFSDVGSMTVKFYEDTTFVVHKWLQKWRGLVQNSDGSYNLPSEFKGNWDFSLLGVDDTVGMVAKVIGTFPTSQQGLTLDYTGSQRIIVSQEFSVDSVNLEQ